MVGPYDAVDAYEAAFGYRNLSDEVDLLLAWFSRHHGGAPASVLELASGPGGHALEFARRGMSATAVDLSAAMCARVAERAAAAGLQVEVLRADIADLRLDRRFDLAILMLDSASVLLTDEAVGAFLAGVARHLEPGGLLIVDLSLRTDGDRRPDWTVEADGCRVRTLWGSPDDTCDPVTGIAMVHVRILVAHEGTATPEVVVDEIVPEHAWTADQLRRLVPGNAMEIVARYGSMSEDIRASDPHAIRDIPVFRRSPVGGKPATGGIRRRMAQLVEDL